MGGGAGLVASCDMAVWVEGAVMGFTEVAIGLIPAVISKFVMEKIGKTHSSRYFLTGERFKGPEAQRIGLVTQTLGTEEELDQAVEKITTQLTKVSPQAVRKAKQLVEKVSQFSSVEASRSFVTQEIAKIRVSEEGQEGLKSFLEKRKP